MAKATIDDVANLAGVSIKTVSRVVNREPNVRDSTREKVEQAIARLHYRPNISARNLASHKSHLIVLIYDDPQAALAMTDYQNEHCKQVSWLIELLESEAPDIPVVGISGPLPASEFPHRPEWTLLRGVVSPDALVERIDGLGDTDEPPIASIH